MVCYCLVMYHVVTTKTSLDVWHLDLVFSLLLLWICPAVRRYMVSQSVRLSPVTAGRGHHPSVHACMHEFIGLFILVRARSLQPIDGFFSSGGMIQAYMHC